MENINWIKNKADISFSTEVMDELSKITDNKDLLLNTERQIIWQKSSGRRGL